MAKKKKGRRLWTRIRGTVPPGTDAADFWGTLRKSIRDEDYKLPEGWDVTIYWRNREDRPFKTAEFTEAMTESKGSSRGFDMAVTSYINRQIARLPNKASVGAFVSARTKREVFTRRSIAAKKGWATRRANFRRRSLAARKGWATRRRRGTV